MLLYKIINEKMSGKKFFIQLKNREIPSFPFAVPKLCTKIELKHCRINPHIGLLDAQDFWVDTNCTYPSIHRKGKGFLPAAVSRPALWSTQPPIQWVLEAFPWGKKAIHSPPSTVNVKNVWSCKFYHKASWHVKGNNHGLIWGTTYSLLPAQTGEHYKKISQYKWSPHWRM